MKKILARATIFSALAFAAVAAEIDLAGGPLTATDLTADYVNSSETAATLTFDVAADAEFTGSISGNIAVVKTGAATLSLLNANTYTGGTTVQEGLVSISSDAAFGSGTVRFAGGGIYAAATMTASKTYAFDSGSTGIVHVAEGKTFTANASMLAASLGATLLKDGLGTFVQNSNPGVVNTRSRWIVEKGTFNCATTGNIFGGHNTTTTNLTIDVRENASFVMSVNAHAPIGVLELTGGTFSCPNPGGWNTPVANTALKGGVYVHASSVPSRIYLQAGAYLNHGNGNTQTVFRVDSGAELYVDGNLFDGKDDVGTAKPTRLIKEGDGILVLNAPKHDYLFSGGVELRGGKVVACSDHSLGAGPLIAAGVVEMVVTNGVEVSVSEVTGSGTLTLSGKGGLVVPTYSALGSGILTCNDGNLGFADYAASLVAAHTAYPTAGLLNTAAETTIETLNFTGDVRIGSIYGTTLTIGSLEAADSVTITGNGVTRVLACDAPVSIEENATAHLPTGTTITENNGLVFLGDSDTATIDKLTFAGKNRILNIPEGKTVTVTSIAGDGSGALADFHKIGAGTLVWPAVAATNFLRDIYVDEGSLSISSATGLGSGNLYLDGGNLTVTANVSLGGAPLKLLQDATVSVSSGATLTAAAGKIVAANHVLSKTGPGTITLSGNAHETHFANARVVVEEGTLSVGQDTWGGHVSDPTVVIEVHEHGLFQSNLHLPLPRVVMRGGRMLNTSRLSAGETHTTWMGFSFRHSFTVLPSTNGTPSVVKSDRCYMEQGDFIPVFDVEEGATLIADTIFQYGFGSSTAVRTAGSFVKNGQGTMVLCRDVECNNAMITIADGTLRIKRDCRIDPDATLVTSGSGRVELEDGASLLCATHALPSALGTAEIWIDATRTAGRNGAALDEIQNFGTAGGKFLPFTVGTIPDKPTYTVSGIAGKPSFVFNGNQLLQLNSYTNKTRNLTIFGVAKRATWQNEGGKGKWAGWVSLSTTSATGDDWATAGAFQYQDVDELNQTIGRNPRSFQLKGTSATGVSYLNFFEDAYTNRTASQYNENGTFVSAVDTGNGGNFNIDLVAIGGRLTTGGKAIYSGSNNGGNRNFIGQLAELIVFSRVLSEDEKADVTAYLKEKWFGVSPEGFLSDANQALSVPAGTASVISVQNGLVKTGEGTLRLGDASTAKSVKVDAGTLALIPTTVVCHAAVWMDASDESAVTVENNMVTHVRNKGSAGGEFTQAIPSGNQIANCPTLSPDINGRNCLVFDGNSALTLRDYVNTNDDWRIAIYFVAKRSGHADLTASGAGKGRWGGPFSMSTIHATATDNSMADAIHLEEYVPSGTVTTSAVLFVADKVSTHTVTLESEIPYLFQIEVGVSSHSYGIEKQGGTMQFLADAYTQPNRSPIFNIDLVQLGGRLGPQGAPQWYGSGNTNNRMWLGSLGEFLVFDHQLSDSEHAAVVNYLKAKWLTDGGTPALPNVLTTSALAPAFGDQTALELEEGATVFSSATTQPLASLTVTGAATLVRDGVTSPADYAMFNVADDVVMPGSMTLRALSSPTASTALIRYGGALNTKTTDWTIESECPYLRIGYKKEGEIRILRANGTVLFMR